MSVDLTNLQDQLAQKQEELNAENQKGGTANAGTVEKLRQEIADITNQIEDINKQAQYQEELVNNDNDIAYVLDNLQVGGLTMRDLTQNENAYQILREVVQMTMMDREQKLIADRQKLADDYEAKLKQSADEKDKLQEQYDELYETNNDNRTALNSVRFELEETKAKRDAAADQIEELTAELNTAKAEIERLNSQVADLQAEKALGAVAAVKVIDTNANSNLADQIAQYNASKPVIYDVQPLDTKQSKFSAKLAATDEEITFGYLEKGKYREVTPDEADTFRAEYLAKQQAEAAEQVQANTDADLSLGDGADITPTVPQFQTEDQPVNGLDETNTDLALAGEAITRQEFEELKARVAQLEGNTVQGAA